MHYLKADTSTKVVIGPVVAVGDGYTPVTTLSLSTADEAEVLKHDASAVTSISGNTFAAITSADGYYNLTLTAAQLDTEGRFTVLINDDSLCLPVRHDFMVVNANVYDSLFAAAATDYLQVDVTQVGGATEDIATETKQDTIDANVDAILVDTGTTLDNHLTDIKGTGFVKDTHSLIDIQTDTAAILVDTGTTLDGKINDIQGATFDTATDSLEAIRNRGDAAWTTGAGGSDRLLMVDTTIATLSTQTSFTLTAGSSDDDAYNNCTIVIEDVSTSTQKSVGVITDYVGSTKTITLKEAPVFTIAATDKVYILAENSLKTTVKNRQLDVTANGNAGIDWGNIENPSTAVDLSGTDIQLVDTCTTNTDMRGTDSAYTGTPPTAAAIADAVWDENTAGHTTSGTFGEQCKTDIDAILVDTADMQPKLGTPAGASISADIATIDTVVDRIEVDTTAIEVDTQDIQSRLPAALVGGKMDSDMTAISGSTTAADNLEASALGIVSTAVNDASASTTAFVTDLTETTDDHYNGRIIVFTSGNLAGQATDITDYTGSTKTVTVTALTEAPADNDTFVIV